MKDYLLGLAVIVLGSVPLGAQTLTIEHRPVGCAVAEKFPRIEAMFTPIESIAAARIVFQPEKSDQWWAVGMKREGTVFFGVLPKPKRSLKAFQYYIEVTGRAMATTRSSDHTTNVVGGAGECKGKLVAGQLGAASVLLQGPGGLGGAPLGFASTGVVAGGSAAGTAAGVVGASTGGGIGTGVIVAGLGAAAAGVAVAAKSGGDASTSSGSSGGSGTTSGPTPGASPTPTPAPTPAPTPTPTAPTMAGHWVGQIVLSGTSCVTDLIYDFAQLGNSFSGTGATSRRVSPGCGTLNGSIESVAGILTGNTFTFTDRFVTGSQFCVESVTGSLSGNQATGTSMGTGQGTGACVTTGMFTITRQ